MRQSVLCPFYQTNPEPGAPSVDVIVASDVPAVRTLHFEDMPSNPFTKQEVYARVYVNGDAWEMDLARKGATGARAYFEACRPRYDKLKALGVRNVSGGNEPHPQNEAEYRAMDEFYVEWVRLVSDYGMIPWIWDWGVGWPGEGTAQWWVKSVRAARAAGGGMIVHLYGAPSVFHNAEYPDECYALRVKRQIRELYAVGLEPGENWIIVGECGIDGGIIDWDRDPRFQGKPRLRGWTDWASNFWVYNTPTGNRVLDEALYWEMLSAYDDELKAIPEVKHVFPFIAHPRPEWHDFVITQYILNRMAAKYVVDEPAVPVPEPEPFRLQMPLESYLRISWDWQPPEHYGIDFSCYEGTSVFAPCDGIARCLTDTAPGGGFGRYIRIETPNYRVYLAHLKHWGVRDGERVEAGQLVGFSGSTGNSSGAHLHLEVRAAAGSPYKYGAVDPKAFLTIPGTKAEPHLPTNDPLTQAAKTEQERYTKIRWWLEEADRQDQDQMPEYARAIRLALIEQMYKWEQAR